QRGGHQPDVHRGLQFQTVVADGRFVVEFANPVFGGVLGHDDHGQNRRNVVGGFLGESVPAAKLPEVGIAGAHHGIIDATGSAVIGGHGQIPVAEMLVEVVQVPGGGAGSFFR